MWSITVVAGSIKHQRLHGPADGKWTLTKVPCLGPLAAIVLWSMRRIGCRYDDLTANQNLEPMLKYDHLGVLNALTVAIRSGTPPAFFPSGRDKISTLSIVEAAIRSSSLGGASVKIESVN
ncbi:MAG: hypothetical protein JO275_13385 [Verrucomicrobia bacterium]|nr:hypothetical protein [Verrucomicrobiota bacterium]